MSIDEFLSWQAVVKVCIIFVVAGFSFDTIFKEKK